MANLIELEERVKTLEEECRKLKDIEAIKNLKYRYWHCVDDHSWDGVADCFAEEANVFGVNLQGRNLIARFYKRTGGKQFTISAHQGHNPEINLLSDRAASGRWIGTLSWIQTCAAHFYARNSHCVPCWSRTGGA